MKFIHAKCADGRKVAFNLDEVLYFEETEDKDVLIEFMNETRIYINEKFEHVEETLGKIR